MFDFSDDAEQHLLCIKLTGFWSMETFERYRLEFQDRVRQIHARAGLCKIFIDTSEFPIQSSDVAAGFRDLVDGQQHRKNMLVAIVLPGSLAKLQAERAVGAPHVRFFFGEPVEALDWLRAQPLG
ncbi:MAG TPA: hypothetical protein VGE65_02445 [Sphingobium sp.]